MQPPSPGDIHDAIRQARRSSRRDIQFEACGGDPRRNLGLRSGSGRSQARMRPAAIVMSHEFGGDRFSDDVHLPESENPSTADSKVPTNRSQKALAYGPKSQMLDFSRRVIKPGPLRERR